MQGKMEMLLRAKAKLTSAERSKIESHLRGILSMCPKMQATYSIKNTYQTETTSGQFPLVIFPLVTQDIKVKLIKPSTVFAIKKNPSTFDLLWLYEEYRSLDNSMCLQRVDQEPSLWMLKYTPLIISLETFFSEMKKIMKRFGVFFPSLSTMCDCSSIPKDNIQGVISKEIDC